MKLYSSPDACFTADHIVWNGEQCRKLVRAQFERANQQLEGKQCLAGFLHICLRWAAATGIDLGASTTSRPSSGAWTRIRACRPR